MTRIRNLVYRCNETCLTDCLDVYNFPAKYVTDKYTFTYDSDIKDEKKYRSNAEERMILGRLLMGRILAGPEAVGYSRVLWRYDMYGGMLRFKRESNFTAVWRSIANMFVKTDEM